MPNSGYGIENPDNVYRHILTYGRSPYEIRGFMPKNQPAHDTRAVDIPSNRDREEDGTGAKAIGRDPYSGITETGATLPVDHALALRNSIARSQPQRFFRKRSTASGRNGNIGFAIWVIDTRSVSSPTAPNASQSSLGAKWRW